MPTPEVATFTPCTPTAPERTASAATPLPVGVAVMPSTPVPVPVLEVALPTTPTPLGPVAVPDTPVAQQVPELSVFLPLTAAVDAVEEVAWSQPAKKPSPRPSTSKTLFPPKPSLLGAPENP